jgi:hypothetical protein
VLIFEFIVFPLGTILAGYALGYANQASVMVISYLAADLLAMITRGRTLMGIKIARITPWKPPYPRVISTVLGGLFLLALTSVAVLELLNGQLFLGLASLSLVALCICYIAARRLKRYERPLAFVSSLLLLAMVLLIALYVQNMAFKLLILLLAVAWGFFVALGAYGLLFRRQHAKL